MTVDQSPKQNGVIAEARDEGRKVHFASLMDLCHLKNSGMEPQLHKYKGRVVLRGDMVKDDSDSYAVLTEQGSSASQMTAAKVMDIISRLPGCSGQAADAVSACIQVKNGRCLNVILQIAQITVQNGRSSCSSRQESVRSSSGRTTHGKGNLRKVY